VKKCLLWFAAALFLTTISVPPTVKADGMPEPPCPKCKPFGLTVGR